MGALSSIKPLPPGSRVLLIEDDVTLGPALLQRLKLEGFDVTLAIDGASAIREAMARPPAMILSDMRLPDFSGEDVFRRITERIGLLPYIFMTAFGDVQQAVRLVKSGAYDYLIKPVNVDVLVDLMKNGGRREKERDVQAAAAPVAPAMRAFEANLAKAARSDLPLLIAGETGVGKERAARMAHELSGRRKHPFIAINCAAIPRELAESTLFGHERGAFTGAHARMQGVVEEVGDGTLLLDEVAELPLELQPKLLRLVQERSFRSVGGNGEKIFAGRLVAATHRDLKSRVSEGLFREDLYYRLAVVALTIPPLRERREEIMPLAEKFLAEASERAAKEETPSRYRLNPAARQMLLDYAWPGNIRELRNRIERACALADDVTLDPADLFPDANIGVAAGENATATSSLEAAAEQAIRVRVRETLRQADGNQSEAARMLGVSRTTIWKYARGD